MKKVGKMFGDSRKSRTFAATQLVYRPIGKEYQAPKEILRRVAQLTTVRPTPRVFFISQSHTSGLDQEIPPRRSGTSWVRGCRGLAPATRSILDNIISEAFQSIIKNDRPLIELI